MRAAILLLLCLTTAARAGHSNVVNDFDPSKPEPLCRADGQFLLHGQNRCKYLRCAYGTEAWKDAEGNTRFYAVERSCPYGTAISRAAYGNGHTSELDERRLCADRVAPHYGGIRYFDPCTVKIPHFPVQNTHPLRYATRHSSTESKNKLQTHSKSQYPAYNPYSAHFPSFHYQVRKADSKSIIERYPNKPSINPHPYSPYGHPAAHYPGYPSAYHHHPYPAYVSYPAKEQEEETEEVEQVVEGDDPDEEEIQPQNQVQEEEEEEGGEIEEAIAQEAEEEAAQEEAAKAEVSEADTAADPLGDQQIEDVYAEDEEEGQEDTGYTE